MEGVVFSPVMGVGDKDKTSSNYFWERGLLEFYVKLNEYSRGSAT